MFSADCVEMRHIAAPRSSSDAGEKAVAARLWTLTGRVQGVGFRPFVHRMANRFDLVGWVCNQGGRLEIHAEGSQAHLNQFRASIRSDLPFGAALVTFSEAHTAVMGFAQFSIKASSDLVSSDCFPPPDLCVCEACLAEMRDPKGHRFRYPFINCAQCGPRFTLLQAMPYDRSRTTMSSYHMCPDCLLEYADLSDRRYHAQPLACARCGPSLSWRQGAITLDDNEASVLAAVKALREGVTVAVKGIGGYHLLCSASSAAAIASLRSKKNRPAKPFAVLVPWSGSDGLEFARQVARLSGQEEDALLQSDRPIVIVHRRAGGPIADEVAPDMNAVGIMLPYSPLLHLLLDEFKGALVATSGNVAGEPLLTTKRAAEDHLRHVAGGWLHHDRDIARAADDSVVAVVASRVRPIRLGRGSTPSELRLSVPIACPTVALGALQKNTIALAWGDRVAVSQHIGDYTSAGGRDRLLTCIGEMEALYRVRPERIILDAHPAMQSSHLAQYAGLPVQRIAHHFAHASAIAGESPGPPQMLCFAWDANGYGADGTLWGGEALLGSPGQWARVASFRVFPLLGGGAASNQPWRSALGLCWQARLPWSYEPLSSAPALRAAYEQNFNCPKTSAVGRLFDAASALLGLCSVASFSAQAAMRLEAVCPSEVDLAAAVRLPLEIDQGGILRTDWQVLVQLLLDDSRSVCSRAQIFHASLALALSDQALAIRRRTGVNTVGLGGGVFQNRRLTELVERTLLMDGFQVQIPHRLPVNDASISFGQIVEMASQDSYQTARQGAQVWSRCP